MIKKPNNNPLEPNIALVSRSKKRLCVALMTSILIFGFLSYISGQGVLQTHWFSFLLMSISSGCWLCMLSQFLSCLFFLRTREKNYPVTKARQSLIIFSIANIFLLFSFFLLLMQQPNADASANVIGFGNVIMLLALSLFLALMIFVVITVFLALVLRIELLPKSSNHIKSSAPQAFENNHPFHTQSTTDEHEPDLAAQARENWDHDPMNPASPEYQSTYRHWWHSDES